MEKPLILRKEVFNFALVIYHSHIYAQQILIHQKHILYLLWLYQWYIANKLKELGYKTNKGNDFRYNQVGNIIKNEKYVGDYLGQKTYIVSPLTHKRNRNFGEEGVLC